MTTPRIRPRKCCLCQEMCTDCRWHEDLKGYLCPRCTMNRLHYSTANAACIGHPLKRLPAFSLEFEVASRDRSALHKALILLKYQFKRTSDGSVDDEYKSPIYQSLRAFCKPLAVLHDLRDLVNERCGTHLHVACKEKERLRAIHSEVFSPVITHMLHHREETIAFWGRFFNRYATAHMIDRYHCFNLESAHPTLEFRLPRFRSAEQYLRVLQCCRAIVAYLDRTLTACAVGEIEGVPEKRCVSPSAMGRHVLALYKRYVKTLPEWEPWLDEKSEEGVGVTIVDEETDEFALDDF